MSRGKTCLYTESLVQDLCRLFFSIGNGELSKRRINVGSACLADVITLEPVEVAAKFARAKLVATAY